MIRILIVDDEFEVRQLLEIFFTELGYQVKTAPDGISAIEMCRLFSPHLVFLDVILPDINGINILSQIREFDKQARVTMISGMHDLSVAKEAINLGAIDYISKPFDLARLKEFAANESKLVLSS